VAEIASVAVYASYFVVPHLVALALWLRRPGLFGRYAAALLGTAYLGLAVSFAVPTAPPWLAGQSGHLPFVSRVVEDVTNGVDPSIYERGYEIVGANPLSAMPSLHMAMTVLVLLAAWRAALPVRVAGLLYALAMGSRSCTRASTTWSIWRPAPPWPLSHGGSPARATECGSASHSGRSPGASIRA
jgi:hypothetical protein